MLVVVQAVSDNELVLDGESDVVRVDADSSPGGFVEQCADLERFRLISFEVKSKIIIREEQIKQYYQDHIEEYRIEAMVHLAGIFLKQKNPDKGQARFFSDAPYGV